jgi:hypothetical protein
VGVKTLVLVGTSDNSFAPLLIGCKRLVLAISISLLAGLASCGQHDTEELTQACIRAVRFSHESSDVANTRANCACAAVSAKKYLDRDDYDLLVKMANVYTESAPADLKLGSVITTLSHWGVSGPRATAAAIDIAAFEGHVARECPNQAANPSGAS